MVDAHSMVGGPPILVSPGQTGTFGFSSSGSQTATLTFTPLGDGLPGSGNMTMSVYTTAPDGSPLQMNVPVSNEAQTSIDVPYGIDGQSGASEFQIGEQPAFGADGSTFPTLPNKIPGVSQLSELNNAAQEHALMTSKSFLVTARRNNQKMNDDESKCDAKCQAAKKAALEKAANQLGDSFGSGP